MNKYVDETVYALINENYFYATMVMKMKRKYYKMSVVAGISVNNGVTLHLDVQKFSQLPLDLRIKILKHECLHIVIDHFKRAKKYGYKNHKLHNISSDVAINQLIENMPNEITIDNNICSLATYNNLKKEVPNLPEYETSDVYYDLFKKEVDKLKDYDEHKTWEENEQNQEVMEQEVSSFLKQCKEETLKVGKTVPKVVAEAIECFNKNKINWKAKLNQFIINASDSVDDYSFKKRNRRYGYEQPGKIREDKLVLTIGIDSSGSISNENLKDFYTEIEKISSYGIDINILECDTEIRREWKFKKQPKYEVLGRGGTLYNPILKRAKELKSDALIYFGDMDYFDNEELKNPKIPMLWVMTHENCKPPANFGRKCHL